MSSILVCGYEFSTCDYCLHELLNHSLNDSFKLALVHSETELFWFWFESYHYSKTLICIWMLLFCAAWRRATAFIFALNYFHGRNKNGLATVNSVSQWKNNAMRFHVFDLHSEQIGPFFVWYLGQAALHLQCWQCTVSWNLKGRERKKTKTVCLTDYLWYSSLALLASMYFCVATWPFVAVRALSDSFLFLSSVQRIPKASPYGEQNVNRHSFLVSL